MLKKEIDEIGEMNMSKERRARYIELRSIQKTERRLAQEQVVGTQLVPEGDGLWILAGLAPFVILGLIVWSIISAKSEDFSTDCVTGVDSQDCLEGGGSGHPLLP